MPASTVAGYHRPPMSLPSKPPAAAAGPLSQGAFRGETGPESTRPESTRHCDTLCPRCGSGDLAKVKGCVVCLQCHYKQDCNGW